MKIVRLSNIGVPLDVQETVIKFSLCCKEFNVVVHSLKRVLDRVAFADLSIITASEDSPATPVIGTKDLRLLLTEMNKIKGSADANLSALKDIEHRLGKVLSDGRKAVVTDTGVLTTVLPKVRSNAAELPEFITEAKTIKHVNTSQGKKALEDVVSIVAKCWASLAKMNLILDQFPIDRTVDPYKHLPENDSEL